ncbi:conserved hypothetical protein [Verticillium alfalfae VaMs.102]|uniref:Protein kinase domain-containing protein n=1 Tax=Verticillium alfalfae (strain VaMs.102 / ATCC MYA-4576 / FGSC 10136) TaxID=526221 RepID=C9S9J6_VERA1|nr:conserved hypothetical protein [Verticillium alfalfae VaMs.102]EEY16059.1 conserved hypothetical protein [Verticillium alfalfae VaMs.102]
MSTHHLEEISSGYSERAPLHLDQSPPGTTLPPIENSFIERYNIACDAEDDDEADTLSDEILDAVVEAGRPTFDQIAPPPAPGATVSTDLHTLFFPDEFSFCFRALDGKADLIRSDSNDTHDSASLDPLGRPFQLNVDHDFTLPRFSTKDIRVLKNILYNGYIARSSNASGRSLSLYATTIRVPKLLGLIEVADRKGAVGFVEEFIPVSATWELTILRNIEAASDIAKDRRKKWALQVQETVHVLHQIGAVWGDGKASNVLIHRDTDDAWIIDFGGGWTDGWATRELSGTVEGDEMAVKKIFDFLEV